jgi:hypothetical protein
MGRGAARIGLQGPGGLGAGGKLAQGLAAGRGGTEQVEVDHRCWVSGHGAGWPAAARSAAETAPTSLSRGNKGLKLSVETTITSEGAKFNKFHFEGLPAALNQEPTGNHHAVFLIA